jgi:hypothetical protein
MHQDLRSGPPRCRVVAAGRLTTYQVAGRGPVVLVLTADQEARERLLARLSSTGRVVAPDLSHPGSGADTASWLAAFVDALGMTQVRLVVDSEYEPAGRSLALSDPDRVHVLVRMHDETGAED